jgi:hypothetical protein
MNTNLILFFSFSFFFVSLNGIYCETGSKHGMSKHGVLNVCLFGDLPSFHEKTHIKQMV